MKHIISTIIFTWLFASFMAVGAGINAKVNTAGVKVPLINDTEFISKKITTAGARTLVIHYFAECQVPRGHIEYDILVNRGILNITSKQLPPTHDDTSALCSNNDPNESSFKAVSVGTVATCRVPNADSFTVRVRGHVVGLGAIDSGLVDEQSLVIEQHELSNDPDIPNCVADLPGSILP